VNNKVVNRVVIFGALAIVLVIAMQSYWVMKTWDINDKQFDQTVQIALLHTARDLAVIRKSTLPSEDVVKRLSSNQYAVNVNTHIDANNLNFYLQHQLEQVGLKEDMEYGIYNCYTEEMVYGKYVTHVSELDTAKLDKNLPKYDKFLYYFVVRFPNRTSYLLGNMGLTLVLTGILFITILFFIFSLGVIMRQKRLSELQKDFINNMTHEFKTPISTIGISADTFLSHPLVRSDPRLTKYAKLIQEQNKRLTAQVERVLQITQVEKESLQLNRETLHLHNLLDTVLASVNVKIEEQNGLLEEIFDAENDFIEADNLHLTNILHNLLDNAMKYSRPGVPPEITVSTVNKGNLLQLSIIDRGIGIDRSHQKMVFERFYRVPTGNVHNVKGFGLGLYYVKNICKAHGWQLRLESELNKGTSIIIEMPKMKQPVPLKEAVLDI
jgi:two-component system, OmpR family, phosphate regulon sensor histidine kinase PhoR